MLLKTNQKSGEYLGEWQRVVGGGVCGDLLGQMARGKDSSLGREN
jgi:hypothetical protein